VQTGKESKPTITLEAVVDARLWFWHAFFGTPGCQNDIVILDRSPLLVDLMYGISPEVSFLCNGQQYNRGYYLADGIFPDWGIFMKTIAKPQGEKRQHYAERQESERKDVERGFAGLQVSVFCFADCQIVKVLLNSHFFIVLLFLMVRFILISESFSFHSLSM